MVEHRVPEGVREMPLRAYLARAYPMAPGWALRDAWKRRDVRVNGDKGAQAVRGGDVVRVYLPEDLLFAQPLSILYEDGEILALEKPSGLPVDVDADGIGEDTVARRLERLRPGARIAHRLDAGTGGALLAGKTPQALERLVQAFASGGVRKEYRAVAVGQGVGEQLLEGYLEKDARIRSPRTVSGRAAHIDALPRPAMRAGKRRVADAAQRGTAHWPHAPDPCASGARRIAPAWGRQIWRSRGQP